VVPGALVTGLAGQVSHCGICRSADLAPVLDMGRQPLPERHDSDERYPLVLLECGACSLIQLSFIPPPREVFPEGHTYSTGSTRALREHFASLAAGLAPVIAPGDLVIDLGCNDGTLLEAVRREAPGVRVLGVEPTGQADRAMGRGITALPEFFSAALGRKMRKTYGPAKTVTACNVLAHVPDAHDFMAGVSHLLADDGVFVTENHDAGAVLDGLQIDTVYHEHLRYYSLTSLSLLLQMHGLVVTSAEKIATHGGSFRVHARRQRTAGLAERAERARGYLLRLLEIASENGKIYGVGACTRATPLIHYAAPMASYIACVCEVPGSDKIGKTMPGTDIPIVDEAKLIADQPPYALLFAWHWADSIVPALRAKGYEGKFIVPLPQARILPG
jgi:C-methyltransferase C-terminal domain/Methyltransferase domain/Putative zinc binding domain